MSETGGSQIAYGAVLDAFPSWSNLTKVSGWDIQRGKTDEFMRPGTGTATIYVNDLTGYLGADSDFPTHARISLRGAPRFRGHIDEINVEVHPSGIVSRVAIEVVDIFDFLAGVEAVPGPFGDFPNFGEEASVVYEADQVDNRMIQVLTEAGLSSSQWSVYSGNINVRRKAYTAGTSVLAILLECAEAEFPNVATWFVDQRAGGVVSFRGRFARFNPSAYGIQEWSAGTMGSVTSGVAQIRELSFTTPKKHVINAAIAYPEGMKESELPDMVVTNPSSIGTYGVRSWSAPDLQVLRHNADGTTGADQAKLYSTYQINNFALPLPRVSRVTFKSLRDFDSRAAAIWDLMMNVEIGDLLHLTTEWISGSYFVEGITQSARELDGTIPFCVTTLDLSPRAQWDVDPF